VEELSTEKLSLDENMEMPQVLEKYKGKRWVIFLPPILFEN